MQYLEILILSGIWSAVFFLFIDLHPSNIMSQKILKDFSKKIDSNIFFEKKHLNLQHHFFLTPLCWCL